MKCFKRLRNSVVAIVHSWWRIAGSHAHLVVVGNRLAVLEEDRGQLVESHVGSREELFDGAVEGFHMLLVRVCELNQVHVAALNEPQNQVG